MTHLPITHHTHLRSPTPREWLPDVGRSSYHFIHIGCGGISFKLATQGSQGVESSGLGKCSAAILTARKYLKHSTKIYHIGCRIERNTSGSGNGRSRRAQARSDSSRSRFSETFQWDCGPTLTYSQQIASTAIINQLTNINKNISGYQR